MAISLYSNNIISILNVGNDVVETTALSNMSFEEEILDGGFSNQKNQYFINGQVEYNKKTKIAKITITAETGSYFTSKPVVKTNDSPLNLSIKSVIRKRESVKRKITSASGNPKPKVISYVLYVYYKNTRSVFRKDRVYCNIEYKTKKYIFNDPIKDSIIDPSYVQENISDLMGPREHLRKSKTINKVTYGTPIMSASGEERVIKIYGSPGAKFKIAVNENQIDGYDSFGKYITHAHNDESILSSNHQNKILSANSYIETPYAKDMPVLEDIIDRTGVYSFRQKFPSTTVHRAKLTTGTSAGKAVVVNSTVGIKKYDRLYTPQLSKDTIRKVDVVDTTNTTNFTLDLNTTIADNSNVFFKRTRLYSIHVFCSRYDINLPSRNPQYRLVQLLDTSISLRATTANSNITINGGGGGVDVEAVYSGEANSRFNKVINVSLLLATGDSKTFLTTTKIPRFSKVNSSYSHWSIKSVVNENATAYGGTNNNEITNPKKTSRGDFNINNIKRTIAGDSNTCTITYDLTISRFPTKDIIIDLDLDSIISLSS